MSNYLSADLTKLAMAGAPDIWERWTIGRWSIDQPGDPEETLHYGDIVTVRSDFFRDYLSGDGAKATALSRYPQAWERWQILDPENPDATTAVKFNDTVRVKSVSFDTYLSGRDDSGVKLSPNHQEWEEWKIIDPSDAGSLAEVRLKQRVRFKSVQFNTFLSGNSDAATALSPNQLDWETWTLGRYPERLDAGAMHYGDLIAIRSESFRNYVGGGDNGSPADIPQSWEQWRIIHPEDSASTAAVRFNDTVLLHSRAFNQFLSGDPNNRTISLAPNQLAYERWKIIDSGEAEKTDPIHHGEVVNFRLAEYPRYLSGSGSSLAMADWTQGWEEWSLRPSWIDPARWMSKIPDETMISRLTIPGTHDSGTYAHVLGTPFTKTQDMSITQQLNTGIRFLDIRVRQMTYAGQDVLWVVHSEIPMNLDLGGVIDACRQFLRENPSETVLMSIKQDAGEWPIFDTFVNEYYNDDPSVWYVGGTLPRLEDVRGKIVLLARAGMNDSMGIRLSIGNNASGSSDIAPGQKLRYTDLYSPGTDGAKIEAIRSNLSSAQDSTSDDELWLTFTSANKPPYGPEYYALEGGFTIEDPIFGIDLYTVEWLNINGWLMENLAPEQGPMGILAMDFPSDALIWFLIGSNDFP